VTQIVRKVVYAKTIVTLVLILNVLSVIRGKLVKHVRKMLLRMKMRTVLAIVGTFTIAN